MVASQQKEEKPQSRPMQLKNLLLKRDLPQIQNLKNITLPPQHASISIPYQPKTNMKLSLRLKKNQINRSHLFNLSSKVWSETLWFVQSFNKILLDHIKRREKMMKT
jgi:hypothetical protein